MHPARGLISTARRVFQLRTGGTVQANGSATMRRRLFDRLAPHRAVEPAVGQIAGAGFPRVVGDAPVVRHRTFAAMDDGVALAPLDHGDLAAGAADEREQHGTGKLDPGEHRERRLEVRRGLEGVPQQVQRRHASFPDERARQVAQIIDRPQHVCAGAAEQGRLVDGGGEAPRRHGGERADGAGPGRVVEFAGRSGAARDHDRASETEERPIEGAAQHRAAVGPFACEGRAAVFVGDVDGVKAGDSGALRSCVELRQIGRRAARQPAPRDAIGDRQGRQDRRLEGSEDGVAKRAHRGRIR